MTASLIPTPRHRRVAEKLHRLGPGAIAYLLAEIAAEEPQALDVAEAYARLPAAFVAAQGGADAPEPLLVAGGRR